MGDLLKSATVLELRLFQERTDSVRHRKIAYLIEINLLEPHPRRNTDAFLH
jgi:hypothetical protein